MGLGGEREAEGVLTLLGLGAHGHVKSWGQWGLCGAGEHSVGGGMECIGSCRADVELGMLGGEGGAAPCCGRETAPAQPRCSF